ncbi:MAG: hypothetical protein OHK0046_15260 [Anaerolineae bacterium]
MPKTVDARQRLAEAPFDYQITKDQRVLLYWHGKLVKTLAGKDARKWIEQIDGADDQETQLMMARATGNFKRGNERA